MTRFHEVQRLPLKRLAVALLVPPLVMSALAVWQVVLGHSFGKQPLPNSHVIGWTVFVWIVYVRLITVRIVTEVRDERLTVAMRGLWRSRRIPLAAIRSAEVIEFDPARDFGGFGIRSGNFGAAYLGEFTHGVRITPEGGPALVVSSARASELAAILRRPVQSGEKASKTFPPIPPVRA